MISRIARYCVLGASLGAAGLAGCSPSYSDQRPAIDELDKRDSGLQSKDVLAASDKLAMDLLALPELNDSRERWTIVFDRVEDNTTGHQFRGDFDIFLRRLQTNIARQGRGRVQIIENKKRFTDIRGRELEGERDDFGQGGGGSKSAPDAVQPDFGLYAIASDLPGRGTTYYFLQFSLTNLKNRTQVWNDAYEVRVSRK